MAIGIFKRNVRHTPPVFLSEIGPSGPIFIAFKKKTPRRAREKKVELRRQTECHSTDISKYFVGLAFGFLLACTSTALEASDTPLFVLEGPVGNSLGDFNITPDGQVLVVGRIGVVELRSATTGELLDRIVHTEKMYFESLSPDGQFFLAWNVEESKLWLWDMQRKEILQTLEMPENVKKSEVATFSPDGQKIVTCEILLRGDPLSGTTKQLGLWDVETGERLRSIPCPRGDLPSHYYHHYFRSFTFSPDGKKALIVYRVNRTGTIISDDYQELWDTVSWQPIRGRTHSWASSFTPDSQFYACTNCAGGFRHGLLSVETGTVVSPHGFDGGWYIQLSPDGRVTIIYNNYGYTLWNPHTGEMLRSYQSAAHYAPKAVFYPNSRSVAVRADLDVAVTGPGHNAITVWDISDLVQSTVGKEAGEY